jgi:four helix bundle protein
MDHGWSTIRGPESLKHAGKVIHPETTMIAGPTLELLSRTKAFSVAAIRFYSQMPRDSAAQILGRQVLRSATSVGAQYREAQRAKSIADFLSKTEGALQEIDETGYWLELIQDAGVDDSALLTELRTEATELLAIFVALTRTAKLNKLRS